MNCKKCIILANGQIPNKSVIKHLFNSGYNFLICADGGANSALKLGLFPNVIIGDLDSISDSTLKYYSGKSKIIRIKRQNDTDVEKCLKFAIKNNYEQTILLGATGDRLDHSFCNLGIVLKYSQKINIKVVHQKSILNVYNRSIAFNTMPGETISIYAFENATKITSIGLKYKLKNTSLTFGEKESTSNVATAEKVSLKFKKGKVFVIRDYNVLRQNDFI